MPWFLYMQNAYSVMIYMYSVFSLPHISSAWCLLRVARAQILNEGDEGIAHDPSGEMQGSGKLFLVGSNPTDEAFGQLHAVEFLEYPVEGMVAGHTDLAASVDMEAQGFGLAG